MKLSTKLPAAVQVRPGTSRRAHVALLIGLTLATTVALIACIAVIPNLFTSQSLWRAMSVSAIMGWSALSLAWWSFVTADELWVNWPAYAAGRRAGE